MEHIDVSTSTGNEGINSNGERKSSLSKYNNSNGDLKDKVISETDDELSKSEGNEAISHQ